LGLFGKKDISLYTDEQLLQEVGRGHAAAFDLLYERYAALFYRYMFRLLGNDKAKAEDFLQDVFVKILKAASTFDPSKSASTWMYTIATNMCRNEWRNTGNRQRLMSTFEPWEHHPDGNIHDKMDHAYRNKALAKVIEGLEHEDQEILQLRFQQELSIREIAAITGLPEGTVKSRLFYLLKKMAKQLNSIAL
jgi:RNA polymerase sigma-70 factor (ECF subfamily)